MKYHTKHKRLLAISDTYMRVFDVKCINLDDVAVWALKNNLWPIPTRNDPPTICEAWERLLEGATK